MRRLHSARRAPLTRTPTTARGFTLIETGMAVVIIGVGVLAMIEAQQAFIQRNAWSTHSSTATFLASEIREMTRGWPRHDAFSGGIYFEDPVGHTNFRGWGSETNELTAASYNDLDDLDGVMFGDATTAPAAIAHRLPGPINASCDPISETTWTGQTATDQNGATINLHGWSQFVMVQKVDPNNYSLVRAHDYFVPAVGATPEVMVDQLPLRVTVVILYQGDLDTQANEVARVIWIVP